MLVEPKGETADEAKAGPLRGVRRWRLGQRLRFITSLSMTERGISRLINARVGLVLLVAGLLACAVVAGCTNSSSNTTPTPTPTVSGSIAPDTLWLQDATSRTVRSYKGVSTASGGQIASVVLNTNDNARPDVVYDPASDTLWYPNQTNPNGTNNTIDIWPLASTRGTTGTNPIITVASGNTNNLEGAAVWDSVHNLLVVAHNTTNTVDIYTGATAMTAASVPAGFVTLSMTDGGVVGTPRPQEMLYDPASDILFVADNGTVCAKFNGFGAWANSHLGTTTALIATTQITDSNLGLATGLAYNHALDVLFTTDQSGTINVVKTASTFNGATTHTQTITNFTAPSGLAYDSVRDILFIYDSGAVIVLPNGSTASGNENSWPGRHVFFDFGTSLSGFGIYVDTTH
jgi:hypothetical protein